MKLLFANFGYKLLALTIALLLWGVAHSSSSIERGFDVPVVVRGVSDDLVVTDRSADEVNLRIQGTRAALRNLSAADLEYVLEVSGAKPGVMTLDVDASAVELPRGAQVVSRSPSRVEITLARRGTRAVEVRPDLEGEPAPGYVLAGVEVEPARVRITGARAEVLRLTELVTETIDVEGADEDVVREVRLSLGGQHIWLEQPTKIQVRVRIRPEEASTG